MLMRSVHVPAAIAFVALAALACDRNDNKDRPGTTQTTGANEPAQTTEPIERSPTYNGPGPVSPSVSEKGEPRKGSESSESTGPATTRPAEPPSSPSPTLADPTPNRPAPIVGAGAEQGSTTEQSKSSASVPAAGNRSTTLGNGKSGQYTGGEGTYGGKATKGTGKPDGGAPMP
jgi:hypothetical protein